MARAASRASRSIERRPRSTVTHGPRGWPTSLGGAIPGSRGRRRRRFACSGSSWFVPVPPTPFRRGFGSRRPAARRRPWAFATMGRWCFHAQDVTKSVRLRGAATATPPGPQSGRLLAAVGIAEIRVRGLHPPRPRRAGTFASACGAIRASAGPRRADLSLAGSVADLDAGGPSRYVAVAAGNELALPAGGTLVDLPPGRVFRADHVRLSSPAPVPPTRSGPTAPAASSIREPMGNGSQSGGSPRGGQAGLAGARRELFARLACVVPGQVRQGT